MRTMEKNHTAIQLFKPDRVSSDPVRPVYGGCGGVGITNLLITQLWVSQESTREDFRKK